MPRQEWLNVQQLTEADMQDSRFCAASCLPALAAVLPSHVQAALSTLPIFRVQGVVCKDSGLWPTSHVPAVAARIGDVASTVMGVQQQRNFTPLQWQAVSTRSPVSQVCVRLLRMHCVLPNIKLLLSAHTLCRIICCMPCNAGSRTKHCVQVTMHPMHESWCVRRCYSNLAPAS